MRAMRSTPAGVRRPSERRERELTELGDPDEENAWERSKEILNGRRQRRSGQIIGKRETDKDA